jgi:hypothetical protein
MISKAGRAAKRASKSFGMFGGLCRPVRRVDCLSMAARRRHSLVEDHPAVSVDALCRAGIITRREDLEGSQWGGAPGCKGQVHATFWIEGDRLDLHIDGAADATVPIEWTACRFGGERPWFRCPRCDARRGRLHYVAGSWACRVCHNLRYKSQRQRLPDRRLDRAHRIRRDVLGQEGYFRVGDPWPPRPRNMKLRRYWDLCMQIQADEAAFMGHVRERTLEDLDWLRRTRKRVEASKKSRR